MGPRTPYQNDTIDRHSCSRSVRSSWSTCPRLCTIWVYHWAILIRRLARGFPPRSSHPVDPDSNRERVAIVVHTEDQPKSSIAGSMNRRTTVRQIATRQIAAMAGRSGPQKHRLCKPHRWSYPGSTAYDSADFIQCVVNVTCHRVLHVDGTKVSLRSHQKPFC